MYQIGDIIVYGTMGVCKVTDISLQKSSGSPAEEQLYYTLNSLSQECVIRTPADHPKVFMRPIITKTEAEQLIDRIPSIQAEAFHSKVLSQLADHYETSLKTHDCADLVELTMSIYAKRLEATEQKRKLGFLDEKFMKRAEELLFSELSAALEIPLDTVPDYIASRIEAVTNA